MTLAVDLNRVEIVFLLAQIRLRQAPLYCLSTVYYNGGVLLLTHSTPRNPIWHRLVLRVNELGQSGTPLHHHLLVLAVDLFLHCLVSRV
jgi:hypothetical protein